MKESILLLIIVLLSGCNSTKTIFEFDKDGNVTKKIETDESVIKQITESTKNKTLYVWSKGWAAKIQASTATTDNPTPTFVIYAGNIDQGILSLHKEQQNLDDLIKVIKACNGSSLSISSDGVSSNSGGK
jgi:hypothetical protein